VNSTTGAVDLASLAAFSRDLGVSSGYQKFPGGFTVQWGGGTYPNATWLTTSFPIAFASACVGVYVIIEYAFAANAVTLNPAALPTTTQFTHFVYNDPTGIPFRFIAIGF
jgi:hypothetical protein